MADKTLCPACQSYTSGIRQAFNNDEPCPVCGLAAATAAEIDAIQTRRADEQIKAELEAALVRAGKAETQVQILAAKLAMVSQELAPLLDQVRNEEWRPMGWNWR